MNTDKKFRNTVAINQPMDFTKTVASPLSRYEKSSQYEKSSESDKHTNKNDLSLLGAKEF